MKVSSQVSGIPIAYVREAVENFHAPGEVIGWVLPEGGKGF